MTALPKRLVIVTESGDSAYAQSVTVGPHQMRADESEAVGGHDTGPSPYEYVMAGLGACTAMTLRMYAVRHNWQLQRASVEVRHTKIISADGKAQVDRFERTLALEGDLTEDQRIHLIDIANRCPVSQTLQRSSIIVTSLAKSP